LHPIAPKELKIGINQLVTRILEKYKVYPGPLSGFWLDIFIQLVQTACNPMNNIDFCLFAYRDVGKGRELGCGSFEQAE